ncbi:antibiotic biosynthesis monooxygenase family protein [Streptomyces sp. NPDC055692]|uniref:antibiotic biosynthesis monooxygenase family protein n=1 Tax=Streptomyces sp. NPDC055692 TaxID=3155683 RepID=UPI003424151A
MSVTLVHVFEVPEGREQEFFDGWRALTEALNPAPGYHGTRLLRRTADQVGRFAFVNIASWESKDAWQAGVNTDEFRALLPAMKDFVGVPGIYEVAYEEGTV